MDGWTERGYSSIIVKVMSGGTLILLSDVSRMNAKKPLCSTVIEPPNWSYQENETTLTLMQYLLTHLVKSEVKPTPEDHPIARVQPVGGSDFPRIAALGNWRDRWRKRR